MKAVTLASGLGFYGDSWEPVVASVQAGAHYVCSDHLAELTLAILQKDRQKNSQLGFARDVVPMLLRLWPMMQIHGSKFVCNAGGLHPLACGLAVRDALGAKGMSARIAVVTGDDVLQDLDDTALHLFQSTPYQAVRDRMVFANAYVGARPIVQALQQGADIVIAGRVADAALFLAPLVHEFGWRLEDAASPLDLNRLAQGIAVGHLLECSGQGSGGNFGSMDLWKSVPDIAHIGYPMAHVQHDGTAVITKAPQTGGRINFDTVRQQLLYEVHNPHAYLTPDVVLDMGTIQLEELGEDRVSMRGATGHARPEKLKVVGGYHDGYKAEVTWGFSWPDAWEKCQTAIGMIRTQLMERKLAHDELYIEYPGLNSAHGALAPVPDAALRKDLNEVWVRMVLRTPHKAVADSFGRLFPWMGLSGPAYTCGFSGLHNTSELLGIWPTLIDRALVEKRIKVEML